MGNVPATFLRTAERCLSARKPTVVSSTIHWLEIETGLPRGMDAA